MSFVLKILSSVPFFFFFNDTATTEIYTLSLHDALPICSFISCAPPTAVRRLSSKVIRIGEPVPLFRRSEEHTSELQSQSNLVCRLLLEKKNRWCHSGVRCQTGQRFGACARPPRARRCIA